jgi:hypothetical protein
MYQARLKVPNSIALTQEFEAFLGFYRCSNRKLKSRNGLSEVAPFVAPRRGFELGRGLRPVFRLTRRAPRLELCVGPCQEAFFRKTRDTGRSHVPQPLNTPIVTPRGEHRNDSRPRGSCCAKGPGRTALSTRLVECGVGRRKRLPHDWRRRLPYCGSHPKTGDGPLGPRGAKTASWDREVCPLGF